MASKKMIAASALSALTIALVGGASSAQAAVPNSAQLGKLDLSSLTSGGPTRMAALADTSHHDHYHDHDHAARAAAASSLSGTFDV